MRLLERIAVERLCEVVRRVGGHHVEGTLEALQDLHRVPQDGLLLLQALLGADLAVHLEPLGIELDARGLPPGQGRTEQRATHAGEGVEDPLSRLGEELDQVAHQLGRLVRPVGLAKAVGQLVGVRRLDDAAGEEQPLLPRHLVEAVPGVDPFTLLYHRVVHGVGDS